MSDVVEILSLHDVRAADTAVAGSKGANLGELLFNGFPIPPGFIVTTHACERFFNTIHLDQERKRLNDAFQGNPQKHAHTIQGLIEDAHFPKDLSAAIQNAHADLMQSRGGGVLCAVRSSAPGEDLSDASFAGQYRTFYSVDSGDLLTRIKQCWASLWNQHAISYRHSRGLDHEPLVMAVVVQEMIQSDASGVVFTANPVNGSHEELVIESAFGLGAAIVDGHVTPDRYIIAREGLKIKTKQVSEKQLMVPVNQRANDPDSLEPVPLEKQRQEAISPELLRTIAEWSIKAEALFGTPQDIEWAAAGSTFFMLQSRPISAMGGEALFDAKGGPYVLFKPIAGNFTDPFTPLSGELITMDLSPRFIQLIGGRLYTNLKYFKLFLPYRVSDEELAEIFYSEEEPQEKRYSLIKLPLALLAFLVRYCWFGVILARSRSLPDDFMDGYRVLVRSVENDPSYGPVETMQRLWSRPKFFDPIGNKLQAVNITTFRFRYWMNRLTKLLERWVPDLPEGSEVLLCSGTEGVLSAEMGREIKDMAAVVRSCRLLGEVFQKHPPEEVLRELQKKREAKGFLDQLERFLGKNGYRALKEYELRSIRWEEDPTPILGMIRNYLLAEDEPGDRQKNIENQRIDLEEGIRRALNERSLEKVLGFRWRLIRQAAERARYFAKLRENSRYYYMMGFNAVRKKIIKLEKELFEQGKLKNKDDIFFLSAKELAGLRIGRLDWDDVAPQIRSRRIHHTRLSKSVPPKTIGILHRDQKQPGEEKAAEGNVLKGQSASPGKYVGPAHVILDTSVDFELHPGEVLVAPYTGPTWTPLFLTAGAVVVEVGSFLSHAGNVAREYGLPCVVDVANCTQRIRTGDRIEVDGDSGLVRILSHGDVKGTR
jgi:pyruvate,water dikinase